MATYEASKDPRWKEEAACHGLTDLFYGQSGEMPTQKLARELAAVAVCHDCPLEAECLEFALETGEKHGVWGGRTEAELRASYH